MHPRVGGQRDQPYVPHRPVRSALLCGHFVALLYDRSVSGTGYLGQCG